VSGQGSTGQPDDEVRRDLAGVRAAHGRLLAAIDGLSDEQARADSRLPEWTVGHVLTHLARNADSHVRLFAAAERGEVTTQYDSAQARADDIETGSRRPATALVADVAASIERLDDAWMHASVGWSGTAATMRGEIPCTDLPFLRWREVEVHTADLGIGPDWSSWSAEYVRLELRRMEMLWASRRPMGLTSLPGEALALEPSHRLAWMLGRIAVDGLEPAGLL
jgi:maleylpyruvate isomerase